MVKDDLSAVNAIGIAVQNVVKSLRHMRILYTSVETRSGLSAEAAAEQCLFAPVSVYRQAIAGGQFGDCPYSRESLFVLSIGEAAQHDDGRSLVFMEESWSRCLANLWVPAMLQGVWSRACALAQFHDGMVSGRREGRLPFTTRAEKNFSIALPIRPGVVTGKVIICSLWKSRRAERRRHSTVAQQPAACGTNTKQPLFSPPTRRKSSIGEGIRYRGGRKIRGV
jgi:hypothetical protein